MPEQVQRQLANGDKAQAAVQIDEAGAIIPSWGPSSSFVAITPGDDTDLEDENIRGLYVGGSGDVAVRAPGSSTTVTFVGVPAGAILPIIVGRVMAATTATNIIGLA